MSDDALAEWVRDAFALGPGALRREVGGGGAEAVVWRLVVGGTAYGLKVPHARVAEADLRREARWLEQLAAAGVEVPVHVATAAGRYAVDVPAALGGGQVRLSHWVEGRAVTAAAPHAEALGRLLAQLHRAAPPTDDRPGPWYTTTPSGQRWADLLGRSAGRPWRAALAAKQDDLAAYGGIVDRAGLGQGPFVVGHRDLHPENALVAADGSLRALDWEDAGPVDPGRELAKVLVQWHVAGDRVDEEGVRATVEAYRAAGGPARVRGVEDTAMVLCTETNFVAVQLAAALDPGTTPEARARAEQEVEEALPAYLPSPAALERLVAVAGA